MRLFAVAMLVLPLATIIGCSAKRVVTVDQVKETLSARLHPGSSTKNDVLTFFASLRIDSLKILHPDVFYPIENLRWDNFDDEKKNALGDRAKEYYSASIRDIAPSTVTFEGFIGMRFYFDEKGILIDYTVKEDAEFRN